MLCEVWRHIFCASKKTSKTGGVEKMTDTSGYTGSHKQRFGEDGKGLGLSNFVFAA